MPIERTPCRKVTAYRAGEYVDDFDCREDIDDFVESAATSYGVDGNRAWCALGNYDEYDRAEPVLFFVIKENHSAAHLSWAGHTATMDSPPHGTTGLRVTWDSGQPHQLAPDDFGVDVETLRTAVFEFLDTGRQPACVHWRPFTHDTAPRLG